MKFIYTFFICAFASAIFAQDAPDFTVTDTHGNEHSLYEDYLDKGYTVVLDLFFVNCPPCNDLAPALEPLYQQWGAGKGDVQFISLTSEPADTDAIVRGFEEMHNTTWPAASAEGGGPAAQAPYATGQWGQFFGYPTLIVISPDRSVQFDIWGDNIAETVELLNDAIIKTEAEGLLSSVEDNLTNVTAFEIFPNPTIDNASIDITLDDSSEVKIEIYNTVGQMIQSIYNGELNSGAQRIEFNASELPAGINWIKVEMNGEAHMEQLIKQ